MGRPKFRVQHFIACTHAGWEGPAGPNTSRTLDGVNYIYFAPPDTEFPFEQFDLWLYARFYLKGENDGECHFELRLYWQPQTILSRRVAVLDLGSIRFYRTHPVINVAWPFRPAIFPGVGQYEFRLYEYRKSARIKRRVRAREYIYIERGHP